MKVIVTGGEGFIGSHLTGFLFGAETYDLKSGQDILDRELFLSTLSKGDSIVHLAAKLSVPESELEPDLYYRNNVLGTQVVADCAKEKGVSKVVFASSAAVYGEYKEPVSEDFDLKPASNYARNKIDGEEILKNSEVPAVVLRYFNVYGPGQSDGYAGVIKTFIKKALASEDIYMFGDGSQVRDFIYVDDVVRANVHALDYMGSDYEVFNIGSGTQISINELLEIILDLTKSKSKVFHKKSALGDIGFSQANISKAKELLGWSPEVSLEEGLIRTIDNLKRNI